MNDARIEPGEDLHFVSLQDDEYSTNMGASLIANDVEPSGVQVLKNPNPLKDVEALAVLDVAVLV